mmetsp:Transcript_36228/g.104291  ORF Transcript_36228/g.104291 Transcript_36228/m.104291 type:complete len:221 (+) Transcript_36228:237-899(+)
MPHQELASTSWLCLTTAGRPSRLRPWSLQSRGGRSARGKTWFFASQEELESLPKPNLSVIWSVTLPEGSQEEMLSALMSQKGSLSLKPTSVFTSHTTRLAPRCSIANNPAFSRFPPSPNKYVEASWCSLETGQIKASGSALMPISPPGANSLPKAALLMARALLSEKGTFAGGRAAPSPPACCGSAGASPPKAKVSTKPPPTQASRSYRTNGWLSWNSSL